MKNNIYILLHKNQPPCLHAKWLPSDLTPWTNPMLNAFTVSYGLSKDPIKCDTRYCQKSRLLKKTLTIYHEGPTLDLPFYYDSSFKFDAMGSKLKTNRKSHFNFYIITCDAITEGASKLSKDSQIKR